jgi:hypothetical protein
MARDRDFGETKQKNIKVHIFEVNIGNSEIKGFSKTRKPAKIRNDVQLRDPHTGQKFLIHPAQWKYQQQISWEWTVYKNSEQLRERFAAVKRGEFVVGFIPRSKLHLYVFRVKMDAADIRVFCTEKNAASWKRREQELTQYVFIEEEFVGEIDIVGSEDCTRLELSADSVYSQIAQNGFFIKVDKVYGAWQQIERAGLWDMQRNSAAFGIAVTNFEIKDIQVAGMEIADAVELELRDEDIKGNKT